MCIGIPMQIVTSNGLVAQARGRNGERRVDLMLVGEQMPGTWLLTFLDAAREVIPAETAQQINAALDGLEAAMSGGSFEQHFADLINRTPELPPHLRGISS